MCVCGVGRCVCVWCGHVCVCVCVCVEVCWDSVKVQEYVSSSLFVMFVV